MENLLLDLRHYQNDMINNYPEGIERFNPPWLDEIEPELIEDFDEDYDDDDDDETSQEKDN